MDFGAKAGSYVDVFMEAVRWVNARLSKSDAGRKPDARLGLWPLKSPVPAPSGDTRVTIARRQPDVGIPTTP
jgi:hypothetical protein